MLNHWHAQDRVRTLHQLGTDPVRGLAPGESTRRLREHGPNLLEEPPRTRRGPGRWLPDALVLVLFAAAALCAREGARLDAAAIGVVALANVALGVLRGRRRPIGEGSVGPIVAPSARVVRGGRTFIVPAADLVAGDLAVLSAGEQVPADLRLLSERGLFADESGLTGEPLPVAKDPAAVLPDATPLAERANMLFAGTSVLAGSGTGVVIATGGRTELGAVARLLAEARPGPPPLTLGLADLGRTAALAALLLAAAVFALLRARGEPAGTSLLAAATIAIAAVPAGVPALVFVSLSAGARGLARRGAAVGSLEAVDTLGAVGVVAAEATGTLSRNETTVREIVLEGRSLEVTGSGFAPEGQILEQGRPADPGDWGTLGIALRIAALCSNARLHRDDGRQDWKVDGDPAEGALLTLAAKGGVFREGLLARHDLLGELSFSPERRRMTVVAAAGDGRPTAFTKGDPGVVLAHCLHHRTSGGVRPLSPEDRERILRRADEMEERALQVLGLAYREDVAGRESAKVERAMVWVGLVGMADPPRPDAAAALAACREAGVRPVIVTGSGRGSALAIAAGVGALDPGEEALTGEELDRLTPEALAASVDRYGLFARVTAEHKLRIVRAWRRRGRHVALHARGVSDAPALREADLGVVAAARAGAAPVPADVVIAEDGFAGILAAILEGRRAAAGLRAGLGHLAACALAGSALLLAAALAGLPAPLNPVELLWVGCVVAVPAAGALGAAASAGARAAGPPGSRRAPLGAPDGAAALALEAGAIALAVFAGFLIARGRGAAPPELARTHAFAILGVAQLVRAAGRIAQFRGVAPAGPGRLRGLGAGALSLLLLLGALILPGAGALFGTVPLGGGEWGLVLVLGLAPLPAAWLLGRGAVRP